MGHAGNCSHAGSRCQTEITLSVLRLASFRENVTRARKASALTCVLGVVVRPGLKALTCTCLIDANAHRHSLASLASVVRELEQEQLNVQVCCQTSNEEKYFWVMQMLEFWSNSESLDQTFTPDINIVVPTAAAAGLSRPLLTILSDLRLDFFCLSVFTIFFSLFRMKCFYFHTDHVINV